jgi:hypothetical protein
MSAYCVFIYIIEVHLGLSSQKIVGLTPLHRLYGLRAMPDSSVILSLWIELQDT